MTITSALFPSRYSHTRDWLVVPVAPKLNIGSPNMTLSAISVMRRSQKKRDSLANIPRKCGVVPWVQRGLLNHNLSHPPVTCCGRLIAAGGGSKLRLQHVAWMHIWFLVQGCGSAQRLSFVLCCDRLILKCGISKECWATPGGSRPHGHSHIWLSSSSYFSSF